jgi:hypothetical protein
MDGQKISVAMAQNVLIRLIVSNFRNVSMGANDFSVFSAGMQE